MSYGSNDAVEDAEEKHRDHCAILIAQCAASLVAAGDMSRDEAIKEVTEWLRLESEAAGDPTRVAAVGNVFPTPSEASPQNQVSAIAFELMDAARDMRLILSEPAEEINTWQPRQHSRKIVQGAGRLPAFRILAAADRCFA